MSAFLSYMFEKKKFIIFLQLLIHTTQCKRYSMTHRKLGKEPYSAFWQVSISEAWTKLQTAKVPLALHDDFIPAWKKIWLRVKVLLKSWKMVFSCRVSEVKVYSYLGSWNWISNVVRKTENMVTVVQLGTAGGSGWEKWQSGKFAIGYFKKLTALMHEVQGSLYIWHISYRLSCHTFWHQLLVFCELTGHH